VGIKSGPSIITIESSDEEMDTAFWVKIVESSDNEVMGDAFWYSVLKT
jgi:hypothetical protein